MKNGSGLNDINRFSAAQVVKLLAYMYPRMTLAPEYISSLPIAGKDGTVRFRMGGTPAAGRVRAKTGTLEDVTALSGFAESLGGRHYAFSILVNDFPDTLRQAMSAEDAFAVALASSGGPSIPSLLVRPEPSEALPAADDRLARYGALATARDPANAPYLRLAVQNERSQDLRAVAAEALYRSEPDEGEAVDALLEVLPEDTAAFEAQRLAGRKAGIAVMLWEAFVDLASDGDGRGMAGLMALAPYADALPEEAPAMVQAPVLTGTPPPAPAPGGSADSDETVDDRRTRAAGLVEVARQAPLELLDAMGLSPAKERDAALALLLFGFKAEPEAAQAFAIQVAEVAKESSNSPVRTFAAQLAKVLPVKQ
jgi:D-alanyl-D-alanine carboxypeptidase/D-alanyl-D-alanine-endopeptidase (penicillin-binding protein 4)